MSGEAAASAQVRTPAALVAEKVFPHFSEEERVRRWTATRQAMAQRGVDCLIVAGSSARYNEMQGNVRYLANVGDKISTMSFVVFPASGSPTLLLGMSVKPSTQALSWTPDIRPYASPDLGPLLAERLQELGCASGRVGLVGVDEYHALPANVFQHLRQRCPACTFTDETALLIGLRTIKSGEEIAFIERACRLGDLAHQAFIDALVEGTDEYEIQAAVEYAICRHGGEGPNLILVNSGPQAPAGPTMVDHQASGRRLRADDVVLVEISSRYGGYYGQSQRTAVLGRPGSTLRSVYAVALEAYHAVQAAVRPGATAGDVLRAGAVIERAGLSHNAPLVHGIGLGAPDYPRGIGIRGRPSADVVFQRGMVLVIEINPVLGNQEVGVFIGNTFVVEDGGVRLLHHTPVDLIIRDGSTTRGGAQGCER